MQIALIINPSSPDAVQALRRGVERLREEGHVVHPRVTFEQGDAHRFAWKSAEYGADLVVACGGDGTINEVVNGLYEWIADREDTTPDAALPKLGIVPLGTGNDLAGGMGIAPGDPEGALMDAASGEEYTVDVARVNGRYFIFASGIGLEGAGARGAAAVVGVVLGVAYIVYWRWVERRLRTLWAASP